MKVHELIKSAREKAGISRYRLSKEIDTSPTNYNNIEDGKHSPSLRMLSSICGVLKVDIVVSKDGSYKTL